MNESIHPSCRRWKACVDRHPRVRMLPHEHDGGWRGRSGLSGGRWNEGGRPGPDGGGGGGEARAMPREGGAIHGEGGRWSGGGGRVAAAVTVSAVATGVGMAVAVRRRAGGGRGRRHGRRRLGLRAAPPERLLRSRHRASSVPAAQRSPFLLFGSISNSSDPAWSGSLERPPRTSECHFFCESARP